MRKSKNSKKFLHSVHLDKIISKKKTFIYFFRVLLKKEKLLNIKTVAASFLLNLSHFYWQKFLCFQIPSLKSEIFKISWLSDKTFGHYISLPDYLLVLYTVTSTRVLKWNCLWIINHYKSINKHLAYYRNKSVFESD